MRTLFGAMFDNLPTASIPDLCLVIAASTRRRNQVFLTPTIIDTNRPLAIYHVDCLTTSQLLLEPQQMRSRTILKTNMNRTLVVKQIKRIHGSTVTANRATTKNGSTRTEGPEQPKRTPTWTRSKATKARRTRAAKSNTISAYPGFVFGKRKLEKYEAVQ